MWVNSVAWSVIIAQLNGQDETIAHLRDINVGAHIRIAVSDAQVVEMSRQKVKDDLTIDWMRHRVNALEKEKAQLLMKVTGVMFSVPEIVPTRPGTMSPFAEFDQMPSFEDVGDREAARLGLSLDESGQLVYAGHS